LQSECAFGDEGRTRDVERETVSGNVSPDGYYDLEEARKPNYEMGRIEVEELLMYLEVKGNRKEKKVRKKSNRIKGER
jgi:hypothetical protein